LEGELTAKLGAERYEHTNERRAYRNGHYRRDLLSKYGPIEGIRVPRMDQGGMEFNVFDRYERRRHDVDAVFGQLFLNGVSTRKLRGIAEELYWKSVSPQTVSNVFACLDQEVARFKEKSISDTVEFLFLDGISQKVREIGIEKKVMLCAFAVHAKRPGEDERVEEIISFQLTDVEDEAA